MSKKEGFLTKEDLSIMSSTTQGVDNQYVPLSGLVRLEKQKLSREEYRKKISKNIESEFKRALLYSDSVVINRAFIINTEELYKPLLSSGDEKTAYLDLFRTQAIIPQLLRERSITQESEREFTTRDKGLQAVFELEKQLGTIACARYSGNDNQNAIDATKSAKAFTSYLLAASTVADEIAKDLGVDEAEFRKKLREVSNFCNRVMDEEKRDYVTRSDLYKEFVCVKGRDKEETSQFIVQGKYDFSKKFWKELKMVFDLKYQANGADGLWIQTLTGRDLPERSALHELDMRHDSEPTNTVDLSTLFSEVIFGQLTNALWIRTINDLNWRDIYSIRQECNEYQVFLDTAEKLKLDAKRMMSDVQKHKKAKNSPLDFKSFINAFYDYQNAIRSKTSAKSAQNIKPAIKIIINIGASVLSIYPEEKLLKLSGASIDALSDPVSTVVAKIIADASKSVDIAINYNFMNARIANAQEEAQRLISMFETKGFRKVEVNRSKQSTATAIATQIPFPESD